MADFQIRQAGLQDMDYIIRLAREEGWNPGLHDAEAFYQADPKGFFLGLLEGKPVGCISAVKYGGFGFIGLFIVEKPYRGGYFGIHLGQAAFKYLEGCNIGLDGVVELQENYARMGFKMAYRNMRFEGSIQDAPESPSSGSIIPAIEADFEELEAYDRRHVPDGRRPFLKYWTSMPDSRTLAILEDGGIRGYGTIRRCWQGWKVGPLFADNPEIAEALFLQLLREGRPGEKVYLDILEENKEARMLADRHGMAFVFETARMYSMERPSLWDEGVYGITTFELG